MSPDSIAGGPLYVTDEDAEAQESHVPGQSARSTSVGLASQAMCSLALKRCGASQPPGEGGPRPALSRTARPFSPALPKIASPVAVVVSSLRGEGSEMYSSQSGHDW